MKNHQLIYTKRINILYIVLWSQESKIYSKIYCIINYIEYSYTYIYTYIYTFEKRTMKKAILILWVIYCILINNVNAEYKTWSSELLEYTCTVMQEEVNEFPEDWEITYTALAPIKKTYDWKNEIYWWIKKSDWTFDFVFNETVIWNYENIISYAFGEFSSSYYYIVSKDWKQDLYVNWIFQWSYYKIAEVSFGFVNDTYLIKVMNENWKYQVFSSLTGLSEEYVYIDFLMINYSWTSALFTATNGDWDYMFIKDDIESKIFKSIYPIYGWVTWDTFIYVYKENEKWYYNIDGEVSGSYDSITDLRKSDNIQSYPLLIRDSFNIFFYSQWKKSVPSLSITDIYLYNNFLYFAWSDNYTYYCQRDEIKINKNIYVKNVIVSKNIIESNWKYGKYISQIDQLVESANTIKLETVLWKIKTMKDSFNQSKYKNIFNYLEAKIELKLISD